MSKKRITDFFGKPSSAVDVRSATTNKSETPENVQIDSNAGPGPSKNDKNFKMYKKVQQSK